MRFSCARVVAAALLIPTVAAAQPRGLDDADIMRLKAVGGVSLSPDGARVLYTVSAWEHPAARGDTALGDRHERRSHVWLVAATGGTPRQLTYGERGESQPSWSPDGSTIAFVTARGAVTGDDAPRPQLWLLPADGGEARQLTTARDGVSGYAWSPDGSHIAFLTTDTLTREQEAKRRRRDDPQVYEGDFRLSHIWVVQIASGKTTKVTSGAFTVSGAPSWSPDGKRLAFAASPTPMIRDERRDAYVADVATQSIERMTTTNDVEGTPQFSPDGKLLAYAMLSHEFAPHKDGIMPRTLRNAKLVTYDLATRTLTNLGRPDFDVSAGQPRWSPDGKELWFTASDRVYQSLFAYDFATRNYVKRSRNALVGGLSPSKDGRTLALTLDAADMPAEVYVQQGAEWAPQRLTTTNGWLAERTLGKSEVITWKSKDGREVEGVLLYPVGYQPGTKVPLVVSAHGGPTSAHTNGFKGGTSPGQTYAARGWAVLYPNPRGSTGYGEWWMHANSNDWGGGDYRDIMTGVDAVIARGIADSSKMAFEGWSYGGYMTSWVVSQTGRFKSAMMGAGLPSLLSMAGTTDIPGYINTFFGQPQYDGSIVNANIRKYLERSGISYSDKVTTPLLILHGGNDERVPIGQPMEFYRALKDRGKTTELVFYPREGHGFTEYYHQLDRMKREYEWLAKFTLGQGTRTAM
ncbi:prolyl oligopeptidase family serine peptidase [Gemmatimonas sp.]|jgi:dipeptidyl aminopeptidase/acylaminoacyl peptidase|uniref:S9 family peptidase n=1 Tax=Gemmatimonas sp. TaxID=1962908 RepID=UPI0037BE296F